VSRSQSALADWMARRFPIYVVEDDEDDLLLLRYCLQRAEAEFRFEFQGNGETFLSFLQTAPSPKIAPFVVLLDLKMPRVDGFEVLSWLKQNKRFSKNPVVVFSSSDLPEDIQRAYSLGANWYIQKPCTLEDYRVLVERLINFCEQISLSEPESS